jgi:hypothetical protein
MLAIYRSILVLLFLLRVESTRNLAEIDSYLSTNRQGNIEDDRRFRSNRFALKNKERRGLKKSSKKRNQGKGSYSTKKSKKSKKQSKKRSKSRRHSDSTSRTSSK